MQNLYKQTRKLTVTIYSSMALALLSLITFAILNEMDAISTFRGVAVGIVFFFVAAAIVADRKTQKLYKQIKRLTSLTR